MKFLIWFFCFFMLAVVQMLFKDAGIILGGIPTLILAGLAFWSKDKLCAAWDKHKAQKAADVTVAGKHAAVPATTPSKPKTRFCKLCGDPVDPVTRKCTGCKKQYFRLPVFTDKHYFIAAVAVACAAVVVLLLTLISTRSAYEAQIQDLHTQISELKGSCNDHVDSINSLQRELAGKENIIDSLRDRIDLLNEEIEFYDRHVVLVFDDGSGLYHKYDTFCTLFMDDTFWIYNTAAAESKGYSPCPSCCD